MAIATDSKDNKGFGSAVTNEWETPDLINAQKRLDPPGCASVAPEQRRHGKRNTAPEQREGPQTPVAVGQRVWR